jgi:hypothetical protein
MERAASRLIVILLGAIALISGVPAAATLSALEGMRNLVPATRAAIGSPTCASQSILTGETEQILTILASSFVFGLAWLIWRRSSRPQRV